MLASSVQVSGLTKCESQRNDDFGPGFEDFRCRSGAQFEV